MIKCANCPNEAAYTCAEPGANSLDYCAACLPVWQRDRALLGHFPLRTLEQAPESKTKKKAKAVVEETVEESAPVEEAPADESN
jgi:hypothetical protein